ncbi:hypothetical protein LTR37_004006 [Vermiconidia calcicola]|uniref:Uncharacterized protein n=1 Tax=Vermiconidia calcicola TaxID=1690605 RepID=A0ACC3NNY9_9PEZI|nr:hypothetical protein LTR37_004006 [Vermiconidia calcicola]
MAAFNVTLLQELGYDVKDGVGFADPVDGRFKAQDYSDEAFAPDAIRSAFSAMATLNPYGAEASVVAAENAYWATNAFAGEGYVPAAATPTSNTAVSATSNPAASNSAVPTAAEPTGSADEPLGPDLNFANGVGMSNMLGNVSDELCTI